MNSMLEPVRRLGKDLKVAATQLTDTEARYLVDAYYTMQEDRKRARNQQAALEKSEEPNAVIGWLGAQAETLEDQIRKALDAYTAGHVMGSWMREVVGIGPVIAAGMLAHIDITRAPTVGHIWRYAGLDPTVKWEKGQKRPWNGELKTLCWKAGQSFMKFSGRDDCYYGKVYKERKEYEVARNESGGNAEVAKELLGKFTKETDARKHLMAGKPPPAQIDARARRYAVKLFLSHLHGTWYQKHFGVAPPLPYPIAIQGHAHFVPPPH